MLLQTSLVTAIRDGKIVYMVAHGNRPLIGEGDWHQRALVKPSGEDGPASTTKDVSKLYELQITQKIVIDKKAYNWNITQYMTKLRRDAARLRHCSAAPIDETCNYRFHLCITGDPDGDNISRTILKNSHRVLEMTFGSANLVSF